GACRHGERQRQCARHRRDKASRSNRHTARAYGRRRPWLPVRARPRAATLHRMPDWSWVPWWLLLLDWAIRLVLVVRVIMQGRPTPVALAWVILLLFIPLFGLVFYILIGEARLGSRRARRYRRLTEGLDQQIVQLWHHRQE